MQCMQMRSDLGGFPQQQHQRVRIAATESGVALAGDIQHPAPPNEAPPCRRHLQTTNQAKPTIAMTLRQSESQGLLRGRARHALSIRD